MSYKNTPTLSVKNPSMKGSFIRSEKSDNYGAFQKVTNMLRDLERIR